MRVFINTFNIYLFMAKKNKGYEEVNKTPRNQGKFSSKHEEPMGTLSLRLPRSIIDWIENQAQQKGSNKTDVVREMIQQQMSTV